jgi:hypothetical protein
MTDKRHLVREHSATSASSILNTCCPLSSNCLKTSNMVRSGNHKGGHGARARRRNLRTIRAIHLKYAPDNVANVATEASTHLRTSSLNAEAPPWTAANDDEDDAEYFDATNGDDSFIGIMDDAAVGKPVPQQQQQQQPRELNLNPPPNSTAAAPAQEPDYTAQALLVLDAHVRHLDFIMNARYGKFSGGWGME